jgi:serine/threonine protein kinase
VSPSSPQGISSSAFSPNYFKRFFIEERVLGKGGKGVVLLVRHELDGVFLGHFACKRVPVGDDHEWLEKVLIEVQALQNLSHQNLVSYRHVWLEEMKLTNFGPSVPCAFILQQYCNAGNLLHYICGPPTTTSKEQLKDRIRRKSRGQAEVAPELSLPRRLHFDEIYSFFKDITSGLAHLHANGFIHRDLKPSNCLLHSSNKEMRCLVSDFGEVQQVNMVRKSTGATGTISYCAPEVLRQAVDGSYGNFTAKSDIFSLGMILYFMCFSRLPYANADDLHEENEDIDQLREEVGAWAGFKDDGRIRSDLPEKLYEFLKRLLSTDPADRPTADEIFQGVSTGSIDATSSTSTPTTGISRISPVDTPPPGASSKSSVASGRKLAGPFNRPPPRLRQRSLSKADRSSSPTRPQSVSPDGKPDPLEADVSSLILRPPRHLSLPNSSALIPSPRLQAPPPASMAALVSNMPLSPTILKAVLFLIKLISLTKPCSPIATNTLVMSPLLCLAALDFVITYVPMTSYQSQWKAMLVRHSPTILLLMAHFVVLLVVVRWNLLCTSRKQVWDGL